MAALDFPSSPTVGQIYIANRGSWQWDGVTWRSGSGGSSVLLEQHTATNVASLDFTNWYSSLYDEYRIEFIGIVPSTAAALQMLMSTNGGVSYDTSAVYRWALNYCTSAAAAGPGGAGPVNALWLIDGNVVFGAGGSWGGHMDFYGAGSSSLFKLVIGQLTYRSTTNFVVTHGGGSYEVVTPVNAFRILFSTGLIASGTVRIYGRGNAPVVVAPPSGFTANQLVADYRFEEPTGDAQNSSTSPLKFGALGVMSGGCATSTVQVFEGTRSVKYTGAFDNNCLSVDVTAGGIIGTADFEISFQAYFQAVSGQWGQGLFGLAVNNPATLAPTIWLAQTTYVLNYASSANGTPVIINSGIVPTLNVWKEIKVKRVAGVTTLYYGGVSVGSAPDTTNYTATRLMFGAYYNQAGGVGNAYFDLLRMYNGNVTP